jgi:hypothetical protein
MWYDDFDAELYKVVPEAERLIAPVADVPMRTTGIPDRTTGRMNHPCVWNGHFGMVAFFGCRLLGVRHWKPSFYVTSAPVVECTFEEAFRDTFVHECLAYVDGRILWNTWKLRADFMTLMYHLRGWPGRSADDAALARRRVLREVARACRRMERVAR